MTARALVPTSSTIAGCAPGGSRRSLSGRTPKRPRKTWRQVHEERPAAVAGAHDALTARIIDLAGYPVYQIGGFALVGVRLAYPDVDLAQFRENGSARRWAGRAGRSILEGSDGWSDDTVFWGTHPPNLSSADFLSNVQKDADDDGS